MLDEVVQRDALTDDQQTFADDYQDDWRPETSDNFKVSISTTRWARQQRADDFRPQQGCCPWVCQQNVSRPSQLDPNRALPQVVIRVRPPLPRELRGTALRPFQCTTSIDNNGRIITLSENLPAVLVSYSFTVRPHLRTSVRPGTLRPATLQHCNSCTALRLTEQSGFRHPCQTEHRSSKDNCVRDLACLAGWHGRRPWPLCYTQVKSSCDTQAARPPHTVQLLFKVSATSAACVCVCVCLQVHI